MIEAAGQLHETLALVAPGTVLRDGLERILRGRTGDDHRAGLRPGGGGHLLGRFHLDVELSAARLRELAKMDGGVVVDMDTARIRAPTSSCCPTPRSRPRRRACATAPPSAWPVRPVTRSSP